MKVVSLANQKGGVSKTTTAVTLAYLSSVDGLDTLLVDMDQQGHATISLGLDKGPGVYTMLIEGKRPETVSQKARAELDLWLIPSDKTTETAADLIRTRNFREQYINKALEGAPFSLALIDLPPSRNILTIASLMASDWVIIPTACDYLSLDGIKELILTIGELRDNGARVKGFSILPTFFDRTTRETREQLKQLVKTFGALVWPPIPRDVRAREAISYGLTIPEYAPDCSAMVGYPGIPAGYRAAYEYLKGAIYG